jgi:hypothetical protein
MPSKRKIIKGYEANADKLVCFTNPSIPVLIYPSATKRKARLNKNLNTKNHLFSIEMNAIAIPAIPTIGNTNTSKE